jgi:hypothetical protein
MEEVEIRNPNEFWVAEDNVYPMMLYRKGDAFKWDGRGTDSLVVADSKEHATATAMGWLEGPAYGTSADEEETEKTLLDKTAKEIEGGLAEMSLEDLEALKADETAGKSRKGVLAMIDAALEEKLAA